MKQSLSSIATVVTGATLRKKPIAVAAKDANTLLMQLGDLDTNGNIHVHTMTPSLMEKNFEGFIAKCGDLIFRGRGAGISVAVMSKTYLPVVIAAPLMIIRPNLKKTDPRFLAWSLTSDQAHRHYTQYSQGSAIVGIGKRDLDLLELNLPDLETQQKIAKLKDLETQVHLLLTRYQYVKSKLVGALINNIIHKEKKVCQTKLHNNK